METTPTLLTTTRREYNRLYHNKRYKDDKVKVHAYQQSLKIKKELNIKKDLWKKYKHHLADIVKLHKIMARVPVELILEILENPITEFQDTEPEEGLTDTEEP
jgi:hypothetical protein